MQYQQRTCTRVGVNVESWKRVAFSGYVEGVGGRWGDGYRLGEHVEGGGRRCRRRGVEEAWMDVLLLSSLDWYTAKCMKPSHHVLKFHR